MYNSPYIERQHFLRTIILSSTHCLKHIELVEKQHEFPLAEKPI